MITLSLIIEERPEGAEKSLLTVNGSFVTTGVVTDKEKRWAQQMSEKLIEAAREYAGETDADGYREVIRTKGAAS